MVLVVDDERDAQEMIASVLTHCDALVTASSSTAEALDRIRTAEPHIVVADIGMPGEDGYTLIRKLRALDAGRYADTPAIALTAYARAEDAARARAAGFDLHLAKPVEPATLVQSVPGLGNFTLESVDLQACVI